MSSNAKLKEVFKKTYDKIKKFFINLRQQKIEVNYKTSLIIIAFLSLLCVVIQAIAQNGLDITGYLSLVVNPLLILFNFIPVFLIMLLFYCIFSKIWVSFLITDIILSVMLFVNHYKVLYRSEPFKFIDIALYTEAMNITQNYDFTFSPLLTLVLCISVFVFLVILSSVKDKKIKVWKRLCALVVVCALMVCAYGGIYCNKNLYDKMYCLTTKFNELKTTAHKGLIYTFLSGINDYSYPEPEEYTEEKHTEILDGYEDFESDYKPNVIGIMSEAFFDIGECENAKFHDGKNPLVNYNRIKKDAMYGDMIVPGFGGSTASTEFEFLTGNNVSLISKALPPPYNTYIIKNVFSIASMFKDYGYDTLGIHPGHNWFYNRESSYAKMGFDDFITIEDIDRKLEQVNYYTSDKEATTLILENYKKHLETKPDTPYFNFTVTIQNHGPYPEKQMYDENRFVWPEGMSEEIYYTINNYSEGLFNADELLGDVMDYINSVDKPTYLVFFGDHLPYLDMEGYDLLGYDITSGSEEALVRKYKVPYLICANDAAKKYMKQHNIKIKNGKQELISANYLSAKLIDYMGASKPAFYQFLNDLSKTVNVLAPHYYIENGEFTKTLSPDSTSLVNNYSILQYKNLKEYKKENSN